MGQYSVDGWCETTDQKVGGSSPSERARSKAPTQVGRGLFCALGSHAGSHGSRSRAEQHLAHRLGRRLLVTFQQMAIDILGDRDAGMAQLSG